MKEEKRLDGETIKKKQHRKKIRVERVKDKSRGSKGEEERE